FPALWHAPHRLEPALLSIPPGSPRASSLGTGLLVGRPHRLGPVARRSSSRRTFRAAFSPAALGNCGRAPHRRRPHLSHHRGAAPSPPRDLTAPARFHS